MENEIWVTCEDDDRYEVSELGTVRTKKTGHLSRGGNIKKYKAIRRHGLRVMYVHRMVAKAFIPNPANKPEVNHKNMNTHDNRAVNLEWCDRTENIRHARDNDAFLRYPPYLIEQMIKLNLVYGFSFIMISELYNMSRWVVRRIIENKRYRDNAITL